MSAPPHQRDDRPGPPPRGPRRQGRRWDPRLVKGAERARWLGHLEERFGIPVAVFDPYWLVQPNVSNLAVVPRQLEPPAIPAAVFQGMLLLHTNMGQPKPSTPAAMTFGGHATRHVITLDAAWARAYLKRQDVFPAPDQLVGCDAPGWVLLRHEGPAGVSPSAAPSGDGRSTGEGPPFTSWILGVGQWVRGESPPRVRSQYPKAWALSPHRRREGAPARGPRAADSKDRSDAPPGGSGTERP